MVYEDDVQSSLSTSPGGAADWAQKAVYLVLVGSFLSGSWIHSYFPQCISTPLAYSRHILKPPLHHIKHSLSCSPLKAFIIYPNPDMSWADYWQTESLGHLPSAASYCGSKVFQTGWSTQSQPLRNTARRIWKILANRMTRSEHRIIKVEKALLVHQDQH